MKDVIEKLQNLIQLDYDAELIYAAAIDRIEETDVRQRFQAFLSDHQAHRERLCLLVASLGGVPIENKRDIKGAFIEGMTSLASKMGTKATLLAMLGNEQLTNHRYHLALGLDAAMPHSVRDVLERNACDEKHHLAYIQAQLCERFHLQRDEASNPYGVLPVSREEAAVNGGSDMPGFPRSVPMDEGPALL